MKARAKFVKKFYKESSKFIKLFIMASLYTSEYRKYNQKHIGARQKLIIIEVKIKEILNEICKVLFEIIRAEKFSQVNEIQVTKQKNAYQYVI